MPRNLSSKQLDEMVAQAREIGIEVKIGEYEDGQAFWGTDAYITVDRNEFVYYLTGVIDARLHIAGDLSKLRPIIAQAQEMQRVRERMSYLEALMHEDVSNAC